jgi:hypothetical protein
MIFFSFFFPTCAVSKFARKTREATDKRREAFGQAQMIGPSARLSPDSKSGDMTVTVVDVKGLHPRGERASRADEIDHAVRIGAAEFVVRGGEPVTVEVLNRDLGSVVEIVTFRLDDQHDGHQRDPWRGQQRQQRQQQQQQRRPAGSAEFSIGDAVRAASATPGRAEEAWLPMAGSSTGMMLVAVSFEPFEDRLVDVGATAVSTLRAAGKMRGAVDRSKAERLRDADGEVRIEIVEARALRENSRGRHPVSARMSFEGQIVETRSGGGNSGAAGVDPRFGEELCIAVAPDGRRPAESAIEIVLVAQAPHVDGQRVLGRTWVPLGEAITRLDAREAQESLWLELDDVAGNPGAGRLCIRMYFFPASMTVANTAVTGFAAKRAAGAIRGMAKTIGEPIPHPMSHRPTRSEIAYTARLLGGLPDGDREDASGPTREVAAIAEEFVRVCLCDPIGRGWSWRSSPEGRIYLSDENTGETENDLSSHPQFEAFARRARAAAPAPRRSPFGGGSSMGRDGSSPAAVAAGRRGSPSSAVGGAFGLGSLSSSSSSSPSPGKPPAAPAAHTEDGGILHVEIDAGDSLVERPDPTSSLRVEVALGNEPPVATSHARCTPDAQFNETVPLRIRADPRYGFDRCGPLHVRIVSVSRHGSDTVLSEAALDVVGIVRDSIAFADGVRDARQPSTKPLWYDLTPSAALSRDAAPPSLCVGLRFAADTGGSADTVMTAGIINRFASNARDAAAESAAERSRVARDPWSVSSITAPRGGSRNSFGAARDRDNRDRDRDDRRDAAADPWGTRGGSSPSVARDSPGVAKDPWGRGGSSAGSVSGTTISGKHGDPWGRTSSSPRQQQHHHHQQQRHSTGRNSTPADGIPIDDDVGAEPSIGRARIRVLGCRIERWPTGEPLHAVLGNDDDAAIVTTRDRPGPTATWNETFEIPLSDLADTVTIKVGGASEIIGRVLIPAADVAPLREPVDVWMRLEERPVAGARRARSPASGRGDDGGSQVHLEISYLANPGVRQPSAFGGAVQSNNGKFSGRDRDSNLTGSGGAGRSSPQPFGARPGSAPHSPSPFGGSSAGQKSARPSSAAGHRGGGGGGFASAFGGSGSSSQKSVNFDASRNDVRSIAAAPRMPERDGDLLITIIEGRSVAPSGSADGVYVSVDAGDNEPEQRTRTERTLYSPKWNETFELTTWSDDADIVVGVNTVTDGSSRGKLVGTIALSRRDLAAIAAAGKPQRQWFDVTTTARGASTRIQRVAAQPASKPSLHLEIDYHPAAASLSAVGAAQRIGAGWKDASGRWAEGPDDDGFDQDSDDDYYSRGNNGSSNRQQRPTSAGRTGTGRTTGGIGGLVSRTAAAKSNSVQDARNSIVIARHGSRATQSIMKPATLADLKREVRRALGEDITEVVDEFGDTVTQISQVRVGRSYFGATRADLRKLSGGARR